MNNTESIKQKILEIKGRDKAKEYTHTLIHSSLACSTMQAIQNLCEVADELDLSFNTRFRIRTIFTAYVLRSGDRMILTENLRQAALTTLFHVIKLTMSVEEQSKILQKLGGGNLMGYFYSQHHHQIIEDLQHVVGQDFEMSTPFEFAELLFTDLGVVNFKKITIELINMAILLTETCKLSAQEIFVGTCLYVYQKYGCSKLYGLLEKFFPESIGSSEELMPVILSALEAQESS